MQIRSEGETKKVLQLSSWRNERKWLKRTLPVIGPCFVFSLDNSSKLHGLVSSYRYKHLHGNRVIIKSKSQPPSFFRACLGNQEGISKTLALHFSLADFFRSFSLRFLKNRFPPVFSFLFCYFFQFLSQKDFGSIFSCINFPLSICIIDASMRLKAQHPM